MFKSRTLFSPGLKISMLAIGLSLIFCSKSIWAGSEAPVVGKSLRYCNPLSIPTSSQNGSAQGVSLGDVTVVEDNGKYYMFCTGGGNTALFRAPAFP